MIRPRCHHPRRGQSAALALLLLGVVGTGTGAGACMSTQRAEPLNEALRTYNDGLRWQRFSAAAAHVPAPRRDDFLDQRDQLGEDLRISHYEIIRVRYNRTEELARVHVKFTWHLDSRGVVHTTHTVQSWKLQGQSWVLASERHLRGEPMPGVPPRDDEPGDDEPGDDEPGDDEPGGYEPGGYEPGQDEVDPDEPAGGHDGALRLGAE